MKNLPSKRGSRDSLAREHICQSSVICRIHHNCSGMAGWTFSDHALAELPQHGELQRIISGSEVRKRPATSEQSPQTSNLASEVNLSCLKREPERSRSFSKHGVDMLRWMAHL